MSDTIGMHDDAAVERELAHYAQMVLMPDPAAVRRIRDAVRREAQIAVVRGRAAARAVEPGATSGLPARPRRRLFSGWSGGRLGMAFAVAVLTGLVLAGTVFASTRAGGPLYDARVWFEQVTLPTNPDARLEAEIARAQTRLAEAADAGVSGDGRAMEAALGAYARIVDETLSEDVVAVTGAERATLAFQHHQSVLEDLQARLTSEGSPAADAVGPALEQSSAAIEQLGGPDAPPANAGTDAEPGAAPGAGQGAGRPDGVGRPSDGPPNANGNGGAPGGNGGGSGGEPGRPSGGTSGQPLDPGSNGPKADPAGG